MSAKQTSATLLPPPLPPRGGYMRALLRFSSAKTQTVTPTPQAKKDDATEKSKANPEALPNVGNAVAQIPPQCDLPAEAPVSIFAPMSPIVDHFTAPPPLFVTTPHKPFIAEKPAAPKKKKARSAAAIASGGRARSTARRNAGVRNDGARMQAARNGVGGGVAKNGSSYEDSSDGAEHESGELEGVLPLQFGSACIRPHQCVNCAIDMISGAEGCEYRGTIHTFFALKTMFKPMFGPYKVLANPARHSEAQRVRAEKELADIFKRFGIDPAERCEPLRIPFEPKSVSAYPPEWKGVYPLYCPNVRHVLRNVVHLVLDDFTVDSANYMANVVTPSLVYLHELSVRRHINPSTRDTLRSLEAEYMNGVERDVLMNAICVRTGSSTSNILADCAEFNMRQSDPRTHLCMDLQPGLDAVMRAIINESKAQRQPEHAELLLCALLHRPGYSFSYTDYLWPMRLGVVLHNKKITYDEKLVAWLVDTHPPTAVPLPSPYTARRRAATQSQPISFDTFLPSDDFGAGGDTLSEDLFRVAATRSDCFMLRHD